jgi:hypothetical protein
MMNSTFDAAQAPPGPDTAVPALLFQLHDDNPQMARVGVAQQLLFPSSPRTVCDEMGLPWQTAVRLQEEGWLSFSLEATTHVDEAQEAELRFVGALVLAGCDQKMLGLLLTGLPRPYSYDLRRLYFDWSGRRWRLLPDPQLHPEAAFTDWLDLLVRTRDVGSLVGIVELAQDAAARVKGRA